MARSTRSRAAPAVPTSSIVRSHTVHVATSTPLAPANPSVTRQQSTTNPPTTRPSSSSSRGRGGVARASSLCKQRVSTPAKPLARKRSLGSRPSVSRQHSALSRPATQQHAEPKFAAGAAPTSATITRRQTMDKPVAHRYVAPAMVESCSSTTASSDEDISSNHSNDYNDSNSNHSDDGNDSNSKTSDSSANGELTVFQQTLRDDDSASEVSSVSSMEDFNFDPDIQVWGFFFWLKEVEF
jgi:hypothetical protein